LKETKKLGFQTMTYAHFSTWDRSFAVSQLSKRLLNNINLIEEILKECAINNWNYRIGSFWPLATHPIANVGIDNMAELPDCQQINDGFQRCSEIIKNNKIRVSTHPDYFTIPASARIDVAEAAIREIDHDAKVLDMFGTEPSHYYPINIHMNSYKDHLDVIVDRLATSYGKMSESAQKRLVIENEDMPRSWPVRKLYDYYYKRLGLPITYDSLHHRLNSDGLLPQDAYNLCKETWRDTKPLFHFSNKDLGSKNQRAHSEFVYERHEELFVDDIDVDFEFKGKDKAIRKFYDDNQLIK
jgi:UV DNA damage endonuclease